MTKEPAASETPVEPLKPLLQSDLPLAAKLDAARMGLLDLSARNRLLNTPRTGKSQRSIEVIDEKATEIYRLLVREERAFTFAAGRALRSDAPEVAEEGPEPDEIDELAQPEDDSVDARGVLQRHADTVLQTRLTSKGLQKRLLEMYGDAITLEQEQGVNILFLAIGMLRWIDPKNAKNIRHAPLILIPVSLERSSAADRFRLRWRHEEITSNLSLEAYLDREHKFRLPSFEAADDFDPAAYCAQVADSIAQKPDWQVLADDMVLGFFSFAKFLMYRDLDAECWPAEASLTSQPLVRALLQDGFPAESHSIPENASVDSYLAPRDLLHVTDADSSQMKAIAESRQGSNLIIQGPPGTGKSQTIANIIGAAVADGKTVLFVAEKMVALSVVKSRLDRAGVGDACLELHSNKANKKTLLQELRRTWELGAPHRTAADTLNENLGEARDLLNSHASAMHAVHPVAKLSTFQVAGDMAELLCRGVQPVDFELSAASTWNPDDLRLRRDMVHELAQRISEMGLPQAHPWRGIGPLQLLPTDVDRLMARVAIAASQLSEIAASGGFLADTLGQNAFAHLAQLERLHVLAIRVASAPALAAEALASDRWNSPVDVSSLLDLGEQHQQVFEPLSAVLRAEAFQAETAADTDALAPLAADLPNKALEPLASLPPLIFEATARSASLRVALGMTPADVPQLSDVQHLLAAAEGVLSAPEASSSAFAAAVWKHGLAQARDLAEAAHQVEAGRAQADGQLLASAWQTDLSSARQTLAAKGSSVFRFLSGEWRAADRIARSFLKDPKAPLPQLLQLLDVHATVRRAEETLQKESEFGKEAFGPDWRGERSSAAALGGMVAWMGSLGSLREEVRQLAAHEPDRHAVRQAAAALHSATDDLTAILEATRSGFPWTSATPLAQIADSAARIHKAHENTTNLFVTLPRTAGERLVALRALQQVQAMEKKLGTRADEGVALFAEAWQGAKSDWPLLRSVLQWVEQNPDIRMLASSLASRAEPYQRAEALLVQREQFLQAWSALLASLQSTPGQLFANEETQNLSIQQLAERLALWRAHPEHLSKWIAYRAAEIKARAQTLDPLVDRLADGRLSPEGASSAFSMAYNEALLRDLFRHEPRLAHFDGDVHSAVVHRFVDFDHQRIRASAFEVVQAHHRHIPVAGGIGPVGVLRGEIAKRSRHLPIRQLMGKAAPAIQALKPVMMMSPLSIAQFLPAGKLSFDLLVMDEASQIQPVDALGAIARCRQVIVVGDERQLPPTRFFSKLTSDSDSDDDEEEDDTTRVGDVESILGLFSARGLPQRMLRWHYRSRHQSLIAVSNSEFYENKLFIIPSPLSQAAGSGLHFQFVPGGIFYSEAKAAEGKFANPVEARTVAEAVMRHAAEHPELSLGVATFSIKQRRAILDQLERLRRLNPAREAFFNAHPGEPFFVKNLENVQGDERDVIFISVGYGRDAQGKFAMRFGPLGMDGGERRLNVLISRAKVRCDVFASITDEDLDPDRIHSKGVFALRLFLQFARTGHLTATRTPEGAGQSSTFVRQAADALRSRGYIVNEGVGLAGCFVDLGIVHPDFPDQYVLGIECDGPSYVSAESSRDRDRLRREVLESHGWTMHRVWSLDWLHRPKEQLDRCVAAIESAAEHLRESAAAQPRASAARLEIQTIDREEATEFSLTTGDRASSPRYEECQLVRPSTLELHETPTGILSSCIQQIVAKEGPIHAEEVAVRLRSIWGLHRSGSRIQAVIERAMAHAEQVGGIVRTGDFLVVPGASVTPRNRSAVSSLTLRRPEMLPPQELEVAILEAVRANFGGTEEEIVRAVSRTFGYQATSAALRQLIFLTAGRMKAKGILRQSNGLLSASES